MDGPHPLDYNATIERMEPGIAPVDPMITLASLAISARAIHSELSALQSNIADIRYALNNQGTAAAMHYLGGKLDHLSLLTDLKIALEKIVKGLEHK